MNLDEMLLTDDEVMENESLDEKQVLRAQRDKALRAIEKWLRSKMQCLDQRGDLACHDGYCARYASVLDAIEELTKEGAA